jgi:hypothetical protein
METRRKISDVWVWGLLSHATGVVLMYGHGRELSLVVSSCHYSLSDHAGLMLDATGHAPASKPGVWPTYREDTALNSVQSAEILVKNYL